MAPLPRFITFAAATVLAWGVLFDLTAPAASAHDSLKRSAPAKNASVSGVQTIELEYSARVRFPAVVLHDVAGRPVALAKPRPEGRLVRADVSGPLAPGGYVIAWRVVSSDGHPIEGEIPFTITGGAASVTSASPSSSQASPAPAAAEDTSSAGIPGWLWIGLAVLAGIGVLVWINPLRGSRTGNES
ncbi:copper resistance protein C [Acrocarpospora corrugata]|uniref:Copper resistance protein C n=1 Tax=Acrocarpospora corrugata TaxID=35763 RepID=A0A5M3WG14_9ACTN|nr:copper resistance protein CopC [Acrocarpospora corrugata]GES06103.1 copper resistance protein C [Acrocarpospora corrugata]